MVWFKRAKKTGMSDKLKEVLLGLSDLESPFVREKDKTYLRYDAMRFEFEEDRTCIVFLWKDVEMFRYWFPPAKGKELTVAGLNGKMEFLLEE